MLCDVKLEFIVVGALFSTFFSDLDFERPVLGVMINSPLPTNRVHLQVHMSLLTREFGK